MDSKYWCKIGKKMGKDLSMDKSLARDSFLFYFPYPTPDCQSSPLFGFTIIGFVECSGRRLPRSSDTWLGWVQFRPAAITWSDAITRFTASENFSPWQRCCPSFPRENKMYILTMTLYQISFYSRFLVLF